MPKLKLNTPTLAIQPENDRTMETIFLAADPAIWMPTWAEFAPRVLVAVGGLAILLLGAIDKLAKNRGNGQLRVPPLKSIALDLCWRESAMSRGRFHSLRFQRRIRVLPSVHFNVTSPTLSDCSEGNLPRRLPGACREAGSAGVGARRRCAARGF